jgi:hypothetical protein
LEKIPTLFLRDPKRMQLVTREVNPDAAWVLDGYGTPTVKKDGTNVRVTVREGLCIYAEKRRNPTREEKAQGAEPGYVDIDERDPSNQHILNAITYTNYADWPDGAWSCEALGPKIQGGRESDVPYLYPFYLYPIVLHHVGRNYDAIKAFLEEHPIEGIVWHDLPLNRAAKIKRRDFGLSWPVKHA